MRSRNNWKSICTAALCAVTVLAIAPTIGAAPIDPATVAPLVAKLADNDAEVRKEAAAQLVGMGPDVKPELQKAIADKADRKVKARVESIITRIDNATAPAAGGETTTVALSGTPITLDLQDVDAADAFDALFAQAKGEYGTQPANLLADKDNVAPVTLKYDKAQFWTVLQDLCKQTGLSLYNSGDGTRMMFSTQNDKDWLTRPSVVANGFLIQASNVNRSWNVNLARPADGTETLQVQFFAYPEPSLRVIRSSYQLKLDEATDDDGNSLIPPQNMGDGYSSGRQAVWQFQAPLNSKAATGNKIAKLSGKAKFGVMTEMARLEVPDIANVKDFTKNLGSMSVTIKGLTKRAGNPTNETYELPITLTRKGGDNDMINMGPQGLSLHDAKGRELSSQGWSGGGGGGGNYTYTMQFGRYARGSDENRPGAPDKLVWDVPTKIADVQIPFEFKDLPLP